VQYVRKKRGALKDTVVNGFRLKQGELGALEWAKNEREKPKKRIKDKKWM
jgi:hypothetical protein